MGSQSRLGHPPVEGGELPPGPAETGLPAATLAALSALTLLAFGLRVWGVRYGFPQPWTRPDETRWIWISLDLLKDPNPRWFLWPTFHGYLQAAAFWVLGHVQVALGQVPSWTAFLNQDRDLYPADLVLCGRLLSALFGTLVVPLTWKLGERTGPPGAGMLGALFLAVSFSPVRDAHWALIESFLLLGMLVTLLLAVRAYEKPTLGRFVLAGIAAGLDTSAKYSAAALVATIPVALALARRRQGRSLAGTLFDRRLIAAAGATMLAFAAGSPFLFIARRAARDAFRIRAWSYTDAKFGTSIGFLHHLVFSLPISQGWPMFLAGLAGILWLSGRSPARLILTAYGAATYLCLGPAYLVVMRYADGLVPCVALGAAWLLLTLAPRLPRPRAFLGAAATLLVALPLYRDLRFDWLLTRKDTRVSAREWLDAHLPPLTRVMARDSKTLRWGRPFLEDRYEVVIYGNRLAARRGADYLLLAESNNPHHVPWAPEIHDWMKDKGEVVAIFDPLRPGAAPVYEREDAFFVPLDGFTGVKEPGPRITLYRFFPEEPGAP